ncbi:tRNA (adenosine(37)-N6)-dimethylallyltransferase MiaA [uncultured Litoreibacter sp.]|uniref:tRNA (adenosine(37)-N6)-dimethylallyltransferase MiaA n=1 Tax=uncultured Litoreibacter sp. TaxID=1392394 RepID=UPI0026205EA5|nr:tRNA (adenosine(37)-N6)-dimethylallyltransferase MiaA [uncultured Litoreibacter sp.]
MLELLKTIDANKPVLIAGPTASGKSSLALAIAESQGGIVVNADALQVFDCWRLLSARPDRREIARAPHALYGHVPYTAPYSTGHWLREVTPLLDGPRPIIVGGTGLNFTALTEGLADIPATPDHIRDLANTQPLQDMLDALDENTRSRIDTANPARIRRAWEVLTNTGKQIAAWQDETPPPTLALKDTIAIVLNSPKDWLNDRITRRFDMMLDQGALEEVKALQHDWDPDRPSAKAIGGPELMGHLNGELTLTEARERSIIASRQYAKRQRTWFKARMKAWAQVDASSLGT